MNHAAEPSGNTDQTAYWNAKAAETWTRLQERTDALFAELTAAALDRLSPRPGERAVDIGCGCGATVLDLARRVGERGHVLGLDVSTRMVERARDRITAAGLSKVEVAVADAASIAPLPVPPDILFSRFGVMFFADPVAAFSRLRQAIRPGGRMLFVAWRPLADNPWFALPFEAARHLIPEQPRPQPCAPGTFALADPDRVTDVLTRSGWRNIAMARYDLRLRLAGPGGKAHATALAMQIGPLASALGEVDATVREEVSAAVKDALYPFDGPEGILLDASVWFVEGRA